MPDMPAICNPARLAPTTSPEDSWTIGFNTNEHEEGYGWTQPIPRDGYQGWRHSLYMAVGAIMRRNPPEEDRVSTPEYPGGYSPRPGNPYQPHPGQTPPGAFGPAPTVQGALPQSSQPQGYASAAPPTQPVRKRRHPVRIAVLILLVLLVLGAGGLFLYARAFEGAITAAAQSFCSDLKSQNYSGAYALLSTGYQAKVTPQQFAQAGQLHDQIDGKVQNCSASGEASGLGAVLQLGSTSVTFPARITRSKSFSGNMTLVNQGGTWKVDAVDESLQGTTLGPILVANDYCSALAAGNVQQAYGDLSPDYQSRLGSEQQYAQTLQSVLTQGVSITGCTPDLSSYSVSGTTAKLNGSLAVQENGVSASLNVALTFVENSAGVWKIDSLTVQP